MTKQTEQTEVKSAGYEILYDLLYSYTRYLQDNDDWISSVEIKQGIDQFILDMPTTIDTFFQRVKSYFN